MPFLNFINKMKISGISPIFHNLNIKAFLIYPRKFQNYQQFKKYMSQLSNVILFCNAKFHCNQSKYIFYISNFMETNQSQQPGQEVAGFVAKTFEILNNEQFQKIIFWSSNGNEFIIKDINKFQEIVLPKYFRHKKINSFIRQLNMYGFHKARKQNTRSVFSHPYFMRNKEQLLPLVKRKLKNSDEPLEQNSIQPPPESKKPMSIKLIESKSFDTPKTTESSTHLMNPIPTNQLIKTNMNMTMKKFSFGDVDQVLHEADDDKLECASIENQLQKTKNEFTRKIRGISLINTSIFLSDMKYHNC